MSILILPSFGHEIGPLLATTGTPFLGPDLPEARQSYINVDSHLTRGYQALTRLQYDLAASELEIAMSETYNPPAASEAATYLGYIDMRLGKSKEAKRVLTVAIRLDPKNDLAYFFLANEYLLEGDRIHSRNAAGKAISINPNFISAMRMLADEYMNEGKPDKALPYYEKISALLPRSSESLVDLFNAYDSANRLPNARDAALRLIQLEPGYLPNYSRAGNIYLSLGNPKMALEEYDKALAKDPTFQPGYLGRAKAYVALHHFREAKAALRDAERIHQNSLDLEETRRLVRDKEREWMKERVGNRLVYLLVILLLASAYWGIYHARHKREIVKILTSFNRGQEQIYDLGELAKYIVAFYLDVTQSQKGALFLFFRQSNQLRLAYSQYLKNEETFPPLVTGLHVFNWAVHQSRPAIPVSKLEDPNFEEAFPSFKDRLVKEGLTHIIPLLERGVVLGFVAIGNGKRISDEILLPLSSVVGRALESLFLYESSVTDETTGLYNKRFFRQSLQSELRRSDRYRQPCSLITFDLDDFKEINDTYGHPQGDRVLKDVSDLVVSCLRGGVDIAARSGGEEFNIILPASDTERAQKVAERIRNLIRDHAFLGLTRRVTISIGMATYPLHADSETAMIAQADRALYQAKAKGKDIVQTAGEEENLPLKAEILHPETLNIFDPATTLCRPDYFALRLEEELKRATRYQFPCSIVLLGFQSSEKETSFEAIRRFAPFLLESLRKGIDTPSALDREHIAIILPETEKEKAVNMAERTCKLAEGYGVKAGIVQYPRDANNEESLMSKLFEALHEAEKDPTRQVVIWEEKVKM